MIYAAVLAGGLGTRMSSHIPKQFLPLGDATVFIHCIRRFLEAKEIGRVYLGIHSEWTDLAQEQIERHIDDASRLYIAPGGENREETLMNVIRAIEADNGLTDADVLLVHDSVRPFVTPRLIRDIIQEMTRCQACNTIVPVIDTIVHAPDGLKIDHVPLRSELFAGQSPQGFYIKMLVDAYASLTPQEKQTLTETTKICLMRDISVSSVRGDYFNFKITTDYDYAVAQNLYDYIIAQF